MSSSILNDVKRLLSLQPEYDAFDPELILYINSAFGTLHQLGVGPAEGFEIEDAEATWDTFLGGVIPLNPVKTYIALRVRMIFDPPNTAYLHSSMESQIAQLEWRLNVYAESRSILVPTVIVEDLDD